MFLLYLPILPDGPIISLVFVRSFVCPFVRCFVCPSVCPLVKSFSQCWLIVFSNFLYEVRELLILKSDGARFLSNINFCPNLGKKGPKIGYYF